MTITKNLIKRIEKAKNAGFKRVEITLNRYKDTIYCQYIDIDWILSQKEGTKTRKTKEKGVSKRTNYNKNTDISYLELFTKY